MTAALIIVLIARRFWQDLHSNPDLGKLSPIRVWLALSGAVYLAGLGFSICFWIGLLRELGQQRAFSQPSAPITSA